jgi:hypothetical protein
VYSIWEKSGYWKNTCYLSFDYMRNIHVEENRRFVKIGSLT